MKIKETRNIFIIFFAICVGCEKENNLDIASLPIKIESIKAEIIDNKAYVKWSSIPDNLFKKYYIIKYDDYSYKTRYKIIDTIDNSLDTIYVDNKIFETPYYAYEIIGELIDSILIKSSKFEINRPKKLTLQSPPVYIQYDKKLNRAYIMNRYSHEITIANYKTCEYIGMIQDSIQMGYIATGNNGFGDEIYVPNYNNTLNIYDAYTFEKKSSFHFDYSDTWNQKIYSVTTNNKGKLYISLELISSSLRIIDRENLIELKNADPERMGDHGGRLLYLENNNSILDISQTVSPSIFILYSLNESGIVSKHRDSGYLGNYNVDEEKIWLCPNEEYFITSMYGYIFSTTLEYKGKLPNGIDNYTSNDDGTKIYYSKGKDIYIYSYPELEQLGKIESLFEPYTLYYESDTLYSLVKFGESTLNIIYEKIALNNNH